MLHVHVSQAKVLGEKVAWVSFFELPGLASTPNKKKLKGCEVIDTGTPAKKKNRPTHVREEGKLSWEHGAKLQTAQ